MFSRLRALAVVSVSILLFGVSSPSRAGEAKDVATVGSMSPTIGRVGDRVEIVCRNVHRTPRVSFNGVDSIASIKTQSGGQRVVTTTVPVGATTGPVGLTTSDGTILNAGIFTVAGALPNPPAPIETSVHGAPVGGQPGSAPNSGGGGLNGYAKGPPPRIDRHMDLPVSPDEPIDEIPKPPTPPEEPPILPPQIYGHDLHSESGSVVYVIDISGSMASGAGSYVDSDGIVQMDGSRLDHAKAELTRSVRSLPKSFRFNLESFDCGHYFWRMIGVQATEANKASAFEWISQLQPQGATGTGPAVAAALQDRNNKLVVLLTDGAPNCGAGDESGSTSCIEAHRKMISSCNGQRATINTFGIGAYSEFKQFCVDVASDSGGSYADVK